MNFCTELGGLKFMLRNFLTKIFFAMKSCCSLCL